MDRYVWTKSSVSIAFGDSDIKEFAAALSRDSNAGGY